MRRGATTSCCLVAAALAVGCGGSDSSPGSNQVQGSGEYTVAVPTASFPAKQRLDAESVMKVAVTNTGDRALPSVGVTVTTNDDGTSAPAFQARSTQQGLAQRYKPVWVIDMGPLNGEAAVSNTWMLGRLEPGATKTFVWRVHPLRTGVFNVRWKVVPAQLRGKAVLASGAPAEGILPVAISGKAPSATVTPSGKVVKKF